MSTRGSQLDAEVALLPPSARDAAILAHDLAGDAAPWIPSAGPIGWAPLEVAETIGGKHRTLIVFVSRGPYAIGTVDDFRHVPAMPATAQILATRRNAILPTRKLVRKIWQAASLKIPMQTFKPDAQQQSPAMWRADDAKLSNVAPQLGAQLLAGALAAGFKKDIVIAPRMDGSRVAIFGGQRVTPDAVQNPLDPWAWQPLSMIHGSDYADHSHGIRFVSRNALLDGAHVDIAQVFADPQLVRLVSDDDLMPNGSPRGDPLRPFAPQFPNASIAALQGMQAQSQGQGAPSPAAAAGEAPTGRQAFEAIGLLGTFIGVAGLVGRALGRK